MHTLVKYQVDYIQTTLADCKTYKFNNILSKKANKEALNHLKQDFVLAPVDKASNNVALICKAYYMSVITAEIKESPTFTTMPENEQNIFDNISNSGYISTTDNLRLPMLYATCKMHKNPKDFRFITAGRDATESIDMCR